MESCVNNSYKYERPEFRIKSTLYDIYLQINIPASEQVSLDSDHRLGLTNIAFPGPLKGFHDLRGGLILSTNGTNMMPKVNDLYSFDDLPLPYQIPVYFCNRTGKFFFATSLRKGCAYQ